MSKVKILEQVMISQVSGRVDPAITNTWSEFCILLKPYIEILDLTELSNFNEVVEIFKRKNLIVLGYYDRLIDILKQIDNPSARVMERKQKEIVNELTPEEKNDIENCKEKQQQACSLVTGSENATADNLEAKMIKELAAKIGPSSKNQWDLFKNWVKVYVDDNAAVTKCENFEKVFSLLQEHEVIKQGDYRNLSDILQRVPAMPAKRILENYSKQINETLTVNQTANNKPEKVGGEVCGKTQLTEEDNMPTSSDGDASTAKFRKTYDDTYSVLITDARAKANKSVGKIISNSGSGTGFRVGSKYILTCWHVVRDIITVKGTFGQCDSQDAKKLDDISVKIQFGFKCDGYNQELTEFGFVGNVLCWNDTLDYAILELKEVRETPFPPAMTDLKTPDSNQDIYFIGHPGGQPMREDPGIKIFERTLQLQNKILASNKMCKDIYKTDDYLSLLNTDKILFHCSFQYGASGSPGIVFEDRIFKVVLMLQGGVPDRWHKMTDEQRTQHGIPNMDLMEYGIGMHTIYDDMSKQSLESPVVDKLRKDIFKQYTESVI